MLIHEWSLVCHRRAPAVRARASPLTTEIKRIHLLPPTARMVLPLVVLPLSDAIKKHRWLHKTSCIDTPTQVSSPRLHSVEYFCRPHVRPSFLSCLPASLFLSLVPRGSVSPQQQTSFLSWQGPLRDSLVCSAAHCHHVFLDKAVIAARADT